MYLRALYYTANNTVITCDIKPSIAGYNWFILRANDGVHTLVRQVTKDTLNKMFENGNLSFESIG